MQNRKMHKTLYFPLLLTVVLFIVLHKVDAAIFLNTFISLIYTSRFGIKKTFPFILLLLLFCSLLNGLIDALLLLVYTLPSFIIGTMIFYKSSYYSLLMTSAVFQCFALTMHTVYLSRTLNKTPAEFLFRDNFNAFLDLIKKSGQFAENEIASLNSMISFVSETLQGMLPCFYILLSLAFVYILFSICRFLLKKSGQKLEEYPYFYELKIPREISLVFVLLFILALFSESLILSNVISVMFTVHVICGISLIDYFMLGKGIPAVFRVLIIFILLSVSTFTGGFFSSVLCCLGMSSRAHLESR